MARKQTWLRSKARQQLRKSEKNARTFFSLDHKRREAFEDKQVKKTPDNKIQAEELLEKWNKNGILACVQKKLI